MVAVQLKLKKSQALFFPILSLVYIYMSMFLGHVKNKLPEIFLGIVSNFALTNVKLIANVKRI